MPVIFDESVSLQRNISFFFYSYWLILMLIFLLFFFIGHEKNRVTQREKWSHMNDDELALTHNTSSCMQTERTITFKYLFWHYFLESEGLSTTLSPTPLPTIPTLPDSSTLRPEAVSCPDSFLQSSEAMAKRNTLKDNKLQRWSEFTYPRCSREGWTNVQIWSNKTQIKVFT